MTSGTALRRIDSTDLLTVEKQLSHDSYRLCEMDDVTSTTDLCMSVDMESESSATSNEDDARTLEHSKAALETCAEGPTVNKDEVDECKEAMKLEGNALSDDLPTNDVLEMEREEPTDEDRASEHTDGAAPSIANEGEISDGVVADLFLTKRNLSLQQTPDTEKEPKRITSILKRSMSDPEFLNRKRGAWKVLPKPDIDAMVAKSTASEPIVNDSSNPRRTNTVVFKDVIIRCYDQTIGDNPSVSYGTPISLDWKFEEMEPICIDLYEDSRGPRRNLRQMILSYFHRRNVLTWQYGFTDEELRAAKKIAKKVKAQRSVTNTFVPVMVVESAFESAGRKARRIFQRSRSA